MLFEWAGTGPVSSETGFARFGADTPEQIFFSRAARRAKGGRRAGRAPLAYRRPRSLPGAGSFPDPGHARRAPSRLLTAAPWVVMRQAEAALKDIASWTVETFAKRQAETYAEDLIEECQAFVDNTPPSCDCRRLPTAASSV